MACQGQCSCHQLQIMQTFIFALLLLRTRLADGSLEKPQPVHSILSGTFMLATPSFSGQMNPNEKLHGFSLNRQKVHFCITKTLRKIFLKSNGFEKQALGTRNFILGYDASRVSERYFVFPSQHGDCFKLTR